MPFDVISYSIARRLRYHTDLLNKEVGGVIDHADGSVARSKLEYPTADVSFTYLAAINKVAYCRLSDNGFAVVTKDTFTDRAVFAAVQVNTYAVLVARLSNYGNYYFNRFDLAQSSGDHWLAYYSGGYYGTLATESVDLDNRGRGFAISCTGSTIKSMRYELDSPVDPLSPPTPTYTLSATNTALASGRYGYRNLYVASPQGGTTPDAVYLKNPMSPAPQTVAYFEAPIIGSGTENDPFRIQMPEEIAMDPVYGKVNRLALSYSVFIVVDTSGKPVHPTAIVRVFDQPDRQPHLRPIPDAIEALKSMRGVRRLTAEQARALALKMDDKLHVFDLISIPRPTKAQIKECIEWRRSVFKIEMDENLAERYLTENKGWE